MLVIHCVCPDVKAAFVADEEDRALRLWLAYRFSCEGRLRRSGDEDD